MKPLFILVHFAGDTVWYRAGRGSWATTLLDNADLYEVPPDIGPAWVAVRMT